MSMLIISVLFWLGLISNGLDADWLLNNYSANEMISVASNIDVLEVQEDLFANFTLTVDGFSQQKGTLRIAVFNSQYDYPDTPTFTQIIRVEDTLVEWRVNNLAYGNYAIAVYHDANENGELDTNFLGIPTEKYGFSNGARGKFGPATWEQAKFPVSHRLESHKITLE